MMCLHAHISKTLLMISPWSDNMLLVCDAQAHLEHRIAAGQPTEGGADATALLGQLAQRRQRALKDRREQLQVGRAALPPLRPAC